MQSVSDSAGRAQPKPWVADASSLLSAALLVAKLLVSNAYIKMVFEQTTKRKRSRKKMWCRFVGSADMMACTDAYVDAVAYVLGSVSAVS